MYIDIDIEDQIREAVEDYLANGGDRIITYAEYQTLMNRVDKIEKEWADNNFWKADRNHSHSRIETEIKELKQQLTRREKV